jgi:hypothetical protein
MEAYMPDMRVSPSTRPTRQCQSATKDAGNAQFQEFLRRARELNIKIEEPGWETVDLDNVEEHVEEREAVVWDTVESERTEWEVGWEFVAGDGKGKVA